MVLLKWGAFIIENSNIAYHRLFSPPAERTVTVAGCEQMSDFPANAVVDYQTEENVKCWSRHGFPPFPWSTQPAVNPKSKIVCDIS